MTIQPVDDYALALADLIEQLVAECGERHRPTLQEALQTAYSLGHEAIAYEAVVRIRAHLARQFDGAVSAG